MLPDYLTFLRFQDKRFLPFLYLITLILLGFYWKNNGYVITRQDAWLVSGIVALIAFDVIFDLKAFWSYKRGVGNIDFSFFDGRRLSRAERLLSQPLAAGLLACCAVWLMIQGCLALPSAVYQLGCLFIFSPLVVYLMYGFVRHSCIKLVETGGAEKVKYKNLYRYVLLQMLVTVTLNVLTVVPLRNNPDFRLSEGYLSPRLMVATLVLCAIVLALNLFMARLSKCYVFLGRLFLKEIDFYFASSFPCRSLHAIPFWLRMVVLLLAQLAWIPLVALALTLLGWDIWFAAWFLLCVVPSLSYCYLHLYWRWQNDFMMSCDMYFRYIEIKKLNDLW